MKKIIKFPSIDQFRTIVSNVSKQSTFTGLDENGNALYDQSIKKPILTFEGTVKLHGTNAGVAYNELEGMWVQSRENIITPQNDNAGFAFFVESKSEVFMDLFFKIRQKEKLNLTKNTIIIYGEWAGKGIQKGVAISEISKSFFIFGVKVKPREESQVSYWVEYAYLNLDDPNIWNIKEFQTYKIDIDFNKPELSQNKMIQITSEVEEQCPVASYFGHSGIGEGVVWNCNYNGSSYTFKVKGEKHSKSKVKTIKQVDDEKIQKCLNIAEKVTPSWRLEQGITEIFNLLNGGQIERKGIGNYLKWVMTDVLKEESDIISKNGLEPKDIGKYVSEIARNYFFEQEKL